MLVYYKCKASESQVECTKHAGIFFDGINK